MGLPGKTRYFWQNFKVTLATVAEGLAASAVMIMGEGREQTPLAVLEDLAFVRFQERNPSKKELKDLKISLKEDVFWENSYVG